ncbi:MAG: anthranilate/aminodeoxychorismate synthase component II [Hadesarchaea archaeon]|nr:MAG: anthranilate/aminodeoxychorismate synthase component II [Hadesarchaea archaeon]
MRVLVIDNIDSFVYNLVQYLGELGAEPVVLTNRSSLKEVEETKPDAIVISPGPKTPSEAGISVEVVRRFSGKIPILGVCLGHQVIAYAFGGRIGKAKRIVHGKTSRIRHDGSRLFKGVPNPFEATRYHSLVVEREDLPEELLVCCETEDAYREIMGIRHRELPIFGLQFHPESILTPEGKKILQNFLEEAG